MHEVYFAKLAGIPSQWHHHKQKNKHVAFVLRDNPGSLPTSATFAFRLKLKYFQIVQLVHVCFVRIWNLHCEACQC